MKIYLIIFSIIICPAFSFAQVGSKSTTTNNLRLILSKPSAYITFERFSKMKPRYDGETGNYVTLRFHNNTKWSLTVRVNGCRPEQEECLAFYEVRKLPNPETGAKDSEVSYGYSAHVAATREVKSGGSFLFSVPKENLAENQYVVVDFSYEWEAFGDAGGGVLDIRHQASFFSYQLSEAKK